MLLVDTCVGPSTIEGVGVFAVQPLAKDTLVWRLEPGFDRVITPDELETLPDATREFLGRYAYFDRILNAWLLDGDHCRFMNHSETPSVEFRIGGTGHVLRDVAAGEELTCDYHDFMDELTLARHFRAGESQQAANFNAAVEPPTDLPAAASSEG